MSERLHQLLTHNAIWVEVPAPLKENCNRNSVYTNYSYGRSLSHALNHTVNGYPRDVYPLLAGLCALFTNRQQINIVPNYINISSEQAQNLTVENYIEFLNINNNGYICQDKFNLCLYHIPKGISYIRKLLDNHTDLTRLQELEAVCMTSPTQFIRIYRGFPGMHPNDVIIFSSEFSPETINNIWTFLPHILNLKLIEGEELTEEQLKYNQKLETLFSLFTILYTAKQDTSPIPYGTTSLAEIKNKINTICKTITELFNFTLENLNTFTINLANARNTIAQSNLSSAINNLQHNIKHSEETLRNYYNELSNKQKLLNAVNLTSADDVAPFLDTVQNTKAIEILSSNPTTLLLRITAPVQYFTEEDLITYEKNIHSDYNDRLKNNEPLKRILHKVFVTREYKLMYQSIIKIDINSSNYSNLPLSFNAQRSDQYFTECPNPHLYYHNCWRSAQMEMSKNITEGNYELVVMQMVAATQSVNIAENPSFIRGFLDGILNSSFIRDRMHFTIPTEDDTLIMGYTQAIAHEKELMKKEVTQEAENKLKETSKEGYTQVEIPDNDEDWGPIPNNNRDPREIIREIVQREVRIPDNIGETYAATTQPTREE